MHIQYARILNSFSKNMPKKIQRIDESKTDKKMDDRELEDLMEKLKKSGMGGRMFNAKYVLKMYVYTYIL
jgi:hypothetical protein